MQFHGISYPSSLKTVDVLSIPTLFPPTIPTIPTIRPVIQNRWYHIYIHIHKHTI